MIFEQIYLGCLAQASYLIGSEGVAAVVDPRRDVDDYLLLANQHGLEITQVILTHIHADFVAGHTELAARTGARICMSHRADCAFDRVPLRDRDTIELGHVVMDVIETPGHTPTDICLLVSDRTTPAQPPKLLTGDTLFLGDVGRPDLASALGFTTAEMAAMMYDSLHNKILPLPDEVEVYPGHGAGSACGRNISNERSSTLKQQRLANHALQPMSREQFVTAQTSGLADPPAYFARAAALNGAGPRLASELPPLAALGTEEVLARRDQGAQIVDARSAQRYGEGHLPGSINIGLAGSFESWCGTLLDLDRPVVIVIEDQAAEEARMRLARVAIEEVIGHAALSRQDSEALVTLEQITVRDLHEKISDDRWQVVDVRRPVEYQSGHVPGARHAPLHLLPGNTSALAKLNRSAPTAIICGSGYRSSAAAHYLRAAGLEDLHNVTGGTSAWLDANLEVER